MKAKIICELAITALLFMSQGAKAQESSKNDDWLLFVEGDDISVYFHAQTLKLQNGFVRAWILYSNKQATPFKNEKHLSEKQLTFFDCANERSSVNTSITYTGQMGRGDVITKRVQNASDWQDPVPDTIGYSELDFMCSKASDFFKK